MCFIVAIIGMTKGHIVQFEVLCVEGIRKSFVCANGTPKSHGRSMRSTSVLIAGPEHKIKKHTLLNCNRCFQNNRRPTDEIPILQFSTTGDNEQ